MNSQYFLKSTQLVLRQHGKTDKIESADCLNAIAKCIRLIADTDPGLGEIIWNVVYHCRSASLKSAALMLERAAREIRIEYEKKELIVERKYKD